jgi:hypothetical protein
MRIITTIIIIAAIATMSSCVKTDETTSYLEPITILTPSFNPTSVSKGSPIDYKIKITNDNYVDSIYIYFQIDSVGNNYAKSKDSVIFKKIYTVSDRSNTPEVLGTYIPPIFPPVGKNMYMTFRYYRMIDVYSKTPKKDSIDKRLTIIVQ